MKENWKGRRLWKSDVVVLRLKIEYNAALILLRRKNAPPRCTADGGHSALRKCRRLASGKLEHGEF